MSEIGYTRVSSYSQNTDRQLVDIDLDKIFTEKASAKDANRPQLHECIEWIREGDVLHVHSIDRLARNLFDLQSLVQQIISKGVSIQFHKENLTFTGDENPMQVCMLQMMGAFAEFERSLINERRKEGIAQAKAKGKQIGRKAKLSAEQVKEINRRISQGETKAALAKEYNVSRQTLYSSISSYPH